MFDYLINFFNQKFFYWWSVKIIQGFALIQKIYFYFSMDDTISFLNPLSIQAGRLTLFVSVSESLLVFYPFSFFAIVLYWFYGTGHVSTPSSLILMFNFFLKLSTFWPPKAVQLYDLCFQPYLFYIKAAQVSLATVAENRKSKRFLKKVLEHNGSGASSSKIFSDRKMYF